MRTHRGGVLLATVLCLLAPGSAAAERLAPDAEVRAILKERMDAKRSAGIVVGILDEGGRRVVAYGDAGSADKPLDGNTVFEIGSITKVFTSSLLSDMVRRGEVKLDGPVSNFLHASVRLPSRNGREITPLDLATQTSGLPRRTGVSTFRPEQP